MKRIHYLYTMALAALILGSCGKGYLTNLAVNPNQPSTSQTSPSLVLSAALASTVAEVQGGDYNAQSTWLGNINYKGGYAISTNTLTYILTNGAYNGCWGNLYYNLTNYNFIVQKVAGTQNNDDYTAIGKIMEVWDFAYLVDNFNNVPYSQTMKAPTVNTPAYDTAETIYTSLVTLLDTAINLINATSSNTTESNPGSFDVLFGGNMSLWAAFANTLKLRLLLQQSEMSGRSSYITQELAVTASTPYLGPGQNAFIQPGYANQNGPNGGNQQNPFYGFLGYTINGSPTGFYAEQGACQAAIDFLNKTNDAFRLPLEYDSVPGVSPASYSAAYFGILPAGNISSLGHYAGNQSGQGFLQGPKVPAVLMSAGESLLMQAEAAERGWISGGDAAAENFYQEGITESFEYLGGVYSGSGSASTATAAAQAYYGQTGVQDVSWSGTTNQKIRAIIMQKWIAWAVLNPMISWNDYRRFQDMTNPDGTTGWPDVPLSQDPNNKATHLPYRVLYPNSEYQLNATNVGAQGTVTADSKIFWMP
ncbi:SusD/RagB family nutrient-binding outer membrane lipoprotein [Dinghuibacter silviterrae]|uniref:SusD-like starch-binding protein associating with outer membrane n=1 Tax=Dinghuibacter silviterrae TaxID=1539049 RepID=A0A4R8DMX9_9BACT|nr:SusD/RagB family nutrient-binding outer membrane lipoprotein [Dinghuibacter silviterrae]TDW99138.1 SusD-like starch-binding protein associating with outer membrane [Dinghuibacter silviterrae]